MTTIIKSKKTKGGYYINGKSILLENWSFHKIGDFFTNEEKEQFDNYIESYSL